MTQSIGSRSSWLQFWCPDQFSLSLSWASLGCSQSTYKEVNFNFLTNEFHSNWILWSEWLGDLTHTGSCKPIWGSNPVDMRWYGIDQGRSSRGGVYCSCQTIIKLQFCAATITVHSAGWEIASSLQNMYISSVGEMQSIRIELQSLSQELEGTSVVYMTQLSCSAPSCRRGQEWLGGGQSIQLPEWHNEIHHMESWNKTWNCLFQFIILPNTKRFWKKGKFARQAR